MRWIGVWVILVILAVAMISACSKSGHTEAPTMIEIPGGVFWVGSRSIPGSVERTVELPSFFIMQTEVSNRQYNQCIKSGFCTDRPDILDYPETLSGDLQPAVCVSWDEANKYCAWLNMRLPTENEWEHAARGSDNLLFPWGDRFEHGAANGAFSPAHKEGDQVYRFSAPGGSFPRDRSPYGVMDMAGNVAEWTVDPFQEDPGNEMPHGFSGLCRVVKGSYFYGERDAHSGAWRDLAPESDRSFQIGFRCVRHKD